MNVLVNIGPQAGKDAGYCEEGSYMPVDIGKYTAFVRAMVERYPMKYWQVGNEPSELSKTGFAELQKITYTAIKEVCPDCVVLIGGVMGFMDKDDYNKAFDEHYKPILDALSGKYADVMDFHWYGNATGDYRGAQNAYNHIRSVLDADGFTSIPIWITEMGSYSGDPAPVTFADRPFQTERQQALDYLKRFIYPLTFGVKKIFTAFGLMEEFKYDGGYFDHTGLIYDGWDKEGIIPSDRGLGVKKLAYYTYKKMTEVLEGSDWDAIEVVRESDDVYVYRFEKNGKPLYVAWWDYFNEPMFVPGNTKEVVLTGLQGLSALVTEAVPKFETGAEVTDYATAFKTSEIALSNGNLSLHLNENPVFVEVLE